MKSSVKMNSRIPAFFKNQKNQYTYENIPPEEPASENSSEANTEETDDSNNVGG